MFKAVPNTITPHDSGALFSGIPSIITFYEDYVDNVEKNLQDSMKTIVPAYEAQLRQQAVRKGWGDSHQTISVSYDPDALELSMTGDPVSEYGTGKEPPRPVIRTAIANIQDLEDAITNQIDKRLF